MKFCIGLESLDNLQVGTYGWQHESWLDGFYPEDLPADWQLDYFSNAFRLVLVPQSVWGAWSDDELEAVQEAVEAPFYFYFAVEASLDAKLLQRLEEIVLVLKPQASGVVLWSEVFFDQTELAGLPVTLISTHYRLPGWCWFYQGLWMSGQPLAYISTLTLDPKAQVALLKDFMQSLTVEADSETSNIEPQGVP